MPSESCHVDARWVEAYIPLCRTRNVIPAETPYYDSTRNAFGECGRLPERNPAFYVARWASPLRVCLLVEPNLPRADAPSNFSKVLADTPNAKVSVCDAAAIVRMGIDADIFCNSHGSIYPAAIGGRDL